MDIEKQKEKFENREYNIKLALAFFFAVTIIFAGIFIFRRVEHWSYVDAFYFSVITLTTIGYGDVVPKTEVGKILAALFALIGVGIFLFCVSTIAENYFFKRMIKFDKSIDNKVTKKINESLKTMDRKIKFIEQMKGHKDKKKEKIDEKNEK